MNAQLKGWTMLMDTIFNACADAEEVTDLSDQDVKSDLVEYRTISWLHNEYVSRLQDHHAKMASRYGRQCVGDLIMSVKDAWVDSCTPDFGTALLKQIDERDL